MGYTPLNDGLGGADEDMARVFRSHVYSRRLVLDHAQQPYPTGQPLNKPSGAAQFLTRSFSGLRL
jgi:hypothetical protein